MTNLIDVPNIRIGVLQSADQVEFLCNAPFSLRNEKGEKKLTGLPNRKYLLTIQSGTPAELCYQVRAGIEKQLEKAEQVAQPFLDQGLHVELRAVGVTAQLKNRFLDNREIWVAVGNFPTYAEALAFKNAQADPGEFVIIENMVKPASGVIALNGHVIGSMARIIPEKNEKSTLITITDVVIGIQFHWQKYEDLDYRGIIEVGFNNQGKLVVINEIDLESYLISVNSSEMTADCPLALLEAQTIAARSTVLATMGKHHYNTNFHLCSDDHCQCYHGKKREQQPSRQAVENTWGEVILFGDEICDARYSKICGGIMEAYHDVWENRKIPYMVSGIDSTEKIDYPANTEEKAKKLIDTYLPVFCNTQLYPLPAKLANLYATKNLFRWEVSYERRELEVLIKEKTGEDIGELLDIVPLQRGDSGRIIYLELIGSKKKLKIGKELEIRRVLSKSHLYSSCFYVKKEIDEQGKVSRFILKGAGWGHGVGLCQVGATVMAMKGFGYAKILEHYYQETQLVKLY